jgi:hypothetical protein
MNETKKSLNLTKSGTIILVFSLICSIVLIVLGIVKLTNDSNGGSSTPSIPTVWAYEGQTCRISTVSDKFYDIKFEPDSRGNITLNIDGAYISSIKTSSGSYVTYNSKSNSNYDHSYTAYLDSYTTYTIRIFTESSSVRFYAN